MRYQTTASIHGPPETAIRIVRDALIANGFRIVDSCAGELTMMGPGMNSSRENPLRGVSLVTARVNQTQLELDAELGGVARLGRFVFFFPIALGLLLMLFFAIIAWAIANFGQQPLPSLIPLLTPLLTTLPWLVIGPWMTRIIRRRTERAIDALVHNATMIATDQ